MPKALAKVIDYIFMFTMMIVGSIAYLFGLLWYCVTGRRFLGVIPFNASAHIEVENTIDILNSGNIPAMEAHAKTVEGFPLGVDPLIQRSWLTNAIDRCDFTAIQWILSKGPDVNWEDDEGLTPLKSAIHREMPDRLTVIQALINAGADVNQPGEGIGITPLHSAAMFGDLETVQALVAAGADPSIYCRDTMPQNAEGYARGQRHKKVAAYLASVRPGPQS